MRVLGGEKSGVTGHHRNAGLSPECGTPVSPPHEDMACLPPSPDRPSQGTPVPAEDSALADWMTSSSPPLVWRPFQCLSALLALFQAKASN